MTTTMTTMLLVGAGLGVAAMLAARRVLEAFFVAAATALGWWHDLVFFLGRLVMVVGGLCAVGLVLWALSSAVPGTTR